MVINGKKYLFYMQYSNKHLLLTCFGDKYLFYYVGKKRLLTVKNTYFLSEMVKNAYKW